MIWKMRCAPTLHWGHAVSILSDTCSSAMHSNCFMSLCSTGEDAMSVQGQYTDRMYLYMEVPAGGHGMQQVWRSAERAHI